MGADIMFFGILLVYTPIAMAYMAGARSEEDVIQYFMQFPMEKLVIIASLPNHGRGLMFLGLCLSYLEK